MVKISKKEAEEKIELFFNSTSELDSKDVKKMRRLAMSKKIKLGRYRKRFCSKCYCDLEKNGKIRISKGYKIIECLKCGNIRRWKIQPLLR